MSCRGCAGGIWAAGLLALIAGCGRKEPAAVSEPGAATTASAPARAAASRAVAEDVPPELRRMSIEGIPVALAPRPDRALLVFFWSESDEGSRERIASAIRLYRRFHAHGLDALGICADSSEAAALSTAERWQMPWPIVMNAKGAGPRPAEVFGLTKTPAAVVATGRPAGSLKVVALDVSREDEAHTAVARVLGVDPARIAMPEKASPRKGWDHVGVPETVSSGYSVLAMSDSDEEEAAEVLVRALRERQDSSISDALMDVVYAARGRGYIGVVEKALTNLEPADQVRVFRSVMTRVGSGIEQVFPRVVAFDEKAAAVGGLSRWDRSQLGRALVLAGEYERGAALMRRVAEESADEPAWWYMVGWAELCAGRGQAAREAFSRAYRPDGRYSGTSPKLAGFVSGYLLGRVSEEELIRSEGAKVAHFFIGERRLFSGDREKALAAYRACVRHSDEPGSPWPSNWARVRIRQLQGSLGGLPQSLPEGQRPWLPEMGGPASSRATAALAPEG